MVFTYTLLAFLLDYDEINLLKIDKVFFIRLATAVAVKKIKTTKTKEHNEKHYDTKQHKKQTKKQVTV